MSDLEKKIAELREEHEAEEKILAYLKLPVYTRNSVCRHHVSHSQKHHWTVRVSLEQTWGGLSLEQVLEIMEQHKAQILDVPFYKQPSFTASWAPESANHSFGKPGVEHQGEAQVEVEQTGGVKFTSRHVSFWLDVPEVGFVEVGLEVTNLPRDQAVYGRHSRFDSRTGEALGVEIGGAKVGLTRTNFGSPGSWDNRSYWASAQDFIDASRNKV